MKRFLPWILMGCFSTWAYAETVELVTYFPPGNAANNQDLRVRTLGVGNDYAASVLPDGHALFSGGVFTRGGNGDFNGDGVISPIDSLRVINYINAATGLPTPEQYARADINGDGRLSAIDAELIIEMINGTLTLAQARTTGKTVSDRAFGIDINGNVGIGTTDPAGRLDVAGDLFVRQAAGSNNHVRIRAASDGNTAIELRSETLGGTPYIDFANDAATDFDVRLALAGDDRLNVEGGTVRVGRNQNATESVLGVTNMNAGNQAVTDFRVGQDVETGNGQYGALNYYGSGTPAGFQGYGNPNQVSLVAALGAVNGLTIATNANAPIRFLTNSNGVNNERMRVTGAGNVGIGTGAPQTPAPNGQAGGNLDANDVFVRGTGRWASQAQRDSRPRATGSYVGNGAADRFINVGFEPTHVIIWARHDGGHVHMSEIWRGMPSDGPNRSFHASDSPGRNEQTNLRIVAGQNGFRVGGGGAHDSNWGVTFYYMAW